ncbi:MAG: ATP-binding cassette domain-containing protein [Dethiobacter sp.]|nr:MAG: ATP-binding cassette domain-containing protein [Dethiobacter sp.]
MEYGALTALEGLHFSIKKGALVALIGPNGAGKSTLLRCISRVLKPTLGTLYLDNRDLQKMPLQEVARSLAVVPQDTAVDFDFSVEEIVSMGRYPYLGRFQRESQQDREIVRRAMETTGIAYLAQKPVTNLSGGERQRVIIARALAQEPDLLLLDEPTANLDINFQVEFLELARKLNREKGITVIAAIHDLNLASQFFEYFILLAEKKILSIGKPEEVLTPENINKAYRAPVVIQRNPLHGKLSITVLKRSYLEEKGQRLKVHVIGGGEESVSILAALFDAGFQLSVGPVTREDSSHQFASCYRLPVVTLPPFSPINDHFHRQHLALMEKAHIVVVPSIPFGLGNLRNLEAVEEMLLSRLTGVILEETPFGERDYCGGKARAVYEKIKEKGALFLPDSEALLSYLHDREKNKKPGW